MGRSGSPLLETNFNKKRWRRRILVRVFGVLAVLMLALVAIVVWVARSLPGIAAGEISRLTDTRIEMGAFDFHRDGSVSIDGIVVRPLREELFYDNAILRAKNIHVYFSLGSLMRLSPQITEIDVEEFILDAQYDLDAQDWNLSGLRLNTSPGRGKPRPTVLLEQGKLRYCRVSGGEIDVVTSVPVEARFGPTTDGGYTFDVKTAKLSGGYGESYLRGSWHPGRFELAGGLSSTDIPSLERAWAVDVLAANLQYDPEGHYELDLSVKNLRSKHSPEVDTFRLLAPKRLQEAGPLAGLQRFFSRYRPFGAVGEIRLDARGDIHALKDSKVTGRLTCEDVSVRDRKFPYAIDHLTGDVIFTESRVTLDQLIGKHGDVNIRIEGWLSGSGATRQYLYHITSDRMPLDEDLYTALKPDQKRLWDLFKPQGAIGVDYRLMRTTPFDKETVIIVDLDDVTATYERFPYALHDLTGTLHFDHDSIQGSDLLAREGDGQIRLDVQIADRSSGQPTYQIAIEANGIPLDSTLGDALPERYRSLYGQFDVQGRADVNARVFTSTDPNMEPLQFLADVSLVQASLQTQALPERVSDISAQASVTPDSLSIKEATGRYGQGAVSLTGGIRFASGDTPRHYHLKIAADEIPVDDAMIKSLPESLRSSVSAFQFEGPVDLALDVRKTDSNEPVEYAATVTCLGDKINHQQFPYPLQDVRGRITVDPRRVTFADLQAKPARQSDWESESTMHLDGQVELAEGQLSQAVLALRAQDLLFTETLGRALPETLKGVYRDLAPRGPFDVNFPALNIIWDAPDHQVVEFDGTVDLKTCSMQISGAGTELAGTAACAGVYDTDCGISMGRIHLDADRFTIKGKDVTDLCADMVYDPNTTTWFAHNFVGDCYGGRVLGDFQVDPTGQGVFQYLVSGALVRVNLQDYLLAGRVGDETPEDCSSGTLNAALSLGAKVGDGSSRLGVCRVDVADMQIGKVSPLANLLAVLRLTEPSDYTFDRMLIESYLKRNKLLISRFDLSGKNLAFTGGGTIDLPDGNVDLTLTARGKRVTAAQPSILQSLTEGLTGAMVRMEVSGTTNNPDVQTKTLPVIEDSLKILGTPQ